MKFGYFMLSDNHYPGDPRSAMICPARPSRVTGIAVDNRGGIGPVAPGLPALKPARRRKTCRKEAVRRESPAL